MKIKGRIPGHNPIILPKQHKFTSLLVGWYHVFNLHQGKQATLASIRSKFWIPNAPILLKKISRECMTCRIRKASPQNPEMGLLPPERLENNVYPFQYVGVDYMGPIFVTVGRRHEKRWVALFTCLTVRAVHVEIVHSLTTNSMIMALNRFCSIRGSPKKIFSDNGTNFVGAEAELRVFVQNLEDEKIEDTLTVRDIEWSFIPPGAPHMGGCWERYVRSIKSAISVILKEQFPKEEVLLTALYEAANVVNNRPLTNVSDDPKDLNPITPNDILMLRTNNTMYETEFNIREINPKKLWQKSQWLADQFWKRWVTEYRPTLVTRSK